MTNSFSPKRVYLDYAAASPVSAEVYLAMQPFFTTEYGNPSAIHTEGRLARQAIERAREKIARSVGVKTTDVLFTGSGTECNNLVILGHIEFLYQQGRAYDTMEVITTKIEHPSILELVTVLQVKGVVVKYVDVDEYGLIQLNSLAEQLTPQTVLLACSYVNSEVGTIQPVSRIARQLRAYEKTAGTEIIIHLDAAQAPLWLSCQLGSLGVDSLALDAGKCLGPKGVGVLVSRKLKQLTSIQYGGGQEGGLRPGTENVAGIVGAAEAIALAQENYQLRQEQVTATRDSALAYITSNLAEAIINGPIGEGRVANNINLSLPGFDTEYAVVTLDNAGVAASTKSACAGAGSGLSNVVLHMTGDKVRSRSTVRLSLGPETTPEAVTYAIDCLATYCQKMKSLTQR